MQRCLKTWKRTFTYPYYGEACPGFEFKDRLCQYHWKLRENKKKRDAAKEAKWKAWRDRPDVKR